MHTTSTNTANPLEEPLQAVLHPIHRRWLEEARRFLDPTLNPRAESWTRSAAVRYLHGEFLDRFRWELALVDELHPFLAADMSERLRCEGARLARLRLGVDRIGHRRRTAAQVAAATHELLEQLALWCAEIEAAAGAIPREALTGEAAAFLVHPERIRP
jgi:hypothetical protein